MRASSPQLAPLPLDEPSHAEHDDASPGDRASAVGALRRADWERARMGIALAAIIAATSGAMMQLAEPKPGLHWVVTAFVAATALACGLSALLSGSERPLGQAHLTALGVLMTLTTLAAVAHIGISSATSVVLVMIVYAYGQADCHRKGWTVFLTCVTGFFTLVILSHLGILSTKRAVLALADDQRQHVLRMGMLVELVLGLAFWLARRGQRAVREAVTHVERARLELARRDALLAEARADLAHAVDAARDGRLSGHVVGPYFAGEVIGRGATGEVYRATPLDGGAPVALKVLHESLRQDHSATERFLREARVASGLASPHIARVMNAGFDDVGTPFIAMELLEGRDLATCLRERPLTVDEAVELVGQVADALEVAHQAGIVHRDVKAQNIFRVEDGTSPRWIVLDFGVSKIHGSTGTLTQNGVVGTPNAMSPEQVRGESVDARTDVFALGAIAYRALTGRPAFVGDDAYSQMYQVVRVQPPAPSAFATLPADVELVLAVALAKDVERRLPTAAALASALGRAAHGDLNDSLRDEARALLAEQPWSTIEPKSRRVKRRARPIDNEAPTLRDADTLMEASFEPELSEGTLSASYA